MEKELMTTQEVADMFEVSKRTVQKWIKAGKVPVIKFGRTVRIKRSDLLVAQKKAAA